MRRRFIVAFGLLFLLFAIGIGTSFYFLWHSSTELGRVVNLHQVEELRQILDLRLHQSERDLQVSDTAFANELDSIIGNVQALDEAVKGCFACHHEPGLQSELRMGAELVDQYKRQYSTFITAVLDTERRSGLQLEAAATAREIDELLDRLMAPANPKLEARTAGAIAEQQRSWRVLAMTLVLTFLAALLVSLVLVRSVTEPVEQLVEATDRIAAGKLGSRLEHSRRDEFGSLMDSFNQMEATLVSNRDRIEGHVGRLTRLNQAVFALHAAADLASLLPRLATAMEQIVEAELYGYVLKADVEGVLAVLLRRHGELESFARSAVTVPEVQSIRDRFGTSGISRAVGDAVEWPFGAWPDEVPPRSLLICWIEYRDELHGALVAANKVDGAFLAEDGELLSALGHGVVETIENIRQHQGLERKLEDLERTLDAQ